jgi:hypothetical protein
MTYPQSLVDNPRADKQLHENMKIATKLGEGK